MAKKSTKVVLRRELESSFRLRSFAIQYTSDRSQVNMVDGDGRLHVWKFAGIDQWNLRDSNPVYDIDSDRKSQTFQDVQTLLARIDELHKQGKERSDFYETLNPYGKYLMIHLVDRIRDLESRVGDLEDWKNS